MPALLSTHCCLHIAVQSALSSVQDIVDKLHSSASCLSMYAHSICGCVQGTVDVLWPASSASSSHLAGTQCSSATQVDMNKTWLTLLCFHRLCFCEGGPICKTRQMCCMLVLTILFSFSTILSRLSVRVCHTGGPVQDMVGMLYTGANHFSTTLTRHNACPLAQWTCARHCCLTSYVYCPGGLGQDMVDMLHTGANHFSTTLYRHNACPLHQWTCARHGCHCCVLTSYVYCTGGLVQDVVGVFHTGTDHFSTTLSRH
jgi:hypothetical protein